MLVVRPMAGAQAHYYLDGPAPGRWLGGGANELALTGAVDEATLSHVLAGRGPSGDALLSRIPKNRRSGFDLILAAPKTVSLLAVLSEGDTEARFLRAHDRAVSSAVGYLERNAAWTRRGAAGDRVATNGFLAASFTHCQSAVGDPHLHSHVVVVNAVKAINGDGRWSALDSRSLYRHARAAGAIFQAALRHELAAEGLRFAWTVSRHGLGDIVGVPRPAIEAASLRHRQVVADLAPDLAGIRGRATAAGRTRGHGPPGPGEPWERRVEAAGWDRSQARRLIDDSRRHTNAVNAGAVAPVGPAAIERLLTERHSLFRRPDVVRAAATLAVAGAAAPDIEATAEAFLLTAVSAGTDTWTSPILGRMEDRIVALALPPGRQPAPVAVTAPGSPSPALADLDDAGRRAVERLTLGGAPVDRLTGTFLGQAAVLDAARGAWEASGHHVALVGSTERGQRRWQAAAGVAPSSERPKHASVVLVDSADRLSTTELSSVVADAAARRAKVVLIEGGSRLPRRQAESPALEVLRGRLPAVDAGADRSPTRVAGPRPTPGVVPAGRDGTVTLAMCGSAARDQIVADWARLRAGGQPARMVALGAEEADDLNARARSALITMGVLHGAVANIGGRSFQEGDEVVALRRDPRLGSVTGGTLGRVSAVDPARNQAAILWAGREEAALVDATVRSTPLAHSYATTPSYLRSTPVGPLLSLGQVEAVALRLHPDQVYEVMPTPGRGRVQVALGPAGTSHGELEAAVRSEAPAPGPLPPVAPPAPEDLGRPLSELSAERERLAEHLLATIPGDPRPDLRQLTEDRAWLVSVPDRPGETARATALAKLDARYATLSAAADGRREWLAAHRPQLQRWADLAVVMTWRETALGRGAEIRPTAAVEAQLGPPPADSSSRSAWCVAAAAIEAHRELWALPDQRLDLSSHALGTPDLSRRASERRVLAATRGLERTTGREHVLTPGGP